MDKSDLCIYGYLLLLGVLSVIYGFIVVVQGDIRPPPMTVNVVFPPDIAQNTTAQSNLPRELNELGNISIYGVNIDVWWGLVEKQPQVYDWSVYEDLLAIVKNNLTSVKVKVNLYFHACQGDFFCDTIIPLPEWVSAIDGIFYTDVQGKTQMDYVSSGVDYLPFLSGRTAVQVYSDFIQDFANTFQQYFDTLIYEVAIGLGPAGELRYPAFQSYQWAAPGVGQFQAYDKYLSIEYTNYANKLAHPEFAFLPPEIAVSYNDIPSQAAFFSEPSKNGSTSDYGVFFLNWYSNRLIQHGSAILSQASAILRAYSPNVTLATKIGCIYWQSEDPSHAAEITAGYLNYTNILTMLSNYDVRLTFGCFDLTDKDIELAGAKAGPQQLVGQIVQTSAQVGIEMVGTNNLIDYSSNYDRIEKNCKGVKSPIVGFSFRYLSQSLLDNLRTFRLFVDDMANPEHLK